ncbi:MAG TPA: SDR family oxidoreductase [Sphingomonas sanguinis]|nr:SDR family oxidoreductase [Sphingomonas sanguinis]
MGKAEDVAGVACFLLSDDAAYVTGSEYRVDGGLTMA